MSYKIETNCVQGAYRPKNGEPRVLPIAQSTTFKYDTSEAMAKLFDLEPGYMYTRLANPTSDMVAQKITMLEGRLQTSSHSLTLWVLVTTLFLLLQFMAVHSTFSMLQ